MRSPVVALPAEQYFADTAAKISPGRTLPPRYAVLMLAHGPSHLGALTC